MNMWPLWLLGHMEADDAGFDFERLAWKSACSCAFGFQIRPAHASGRTSAVVLQPRHPPSADFARPVVDLEIIIPVLNGGEPAPADAAPHDCVPREPDVELSRRHRRQRKCRPDRRSRSTRRFERTCACTRRRVFVSRQGCRGRVGGIRRPALATSATWTPIWLRRSRH